MSLGVKIKNHMDGRGIKQRYVAKKAGIEEPKLSAILNGKRGIKAEEYFSICDALKVPLETFDPHKQTA
jgi:transcriptional regulator with XRE-family HTH domain